MQVYTAQPYGTGFKLTVHAFWKKFEMMKDVAWLFLYALWAPVHCKYVGSLVNILYGRWNISHIQTWMHKHTRQHQLVSGELQLITMVPEA